ncbi:hypothetical protein [Laspinema palackyanum]|uniref:hypothetical protein n=1 Tax=Laspinema palackyanum TaxID=3231601 RepID=UPI00345C8718|nr:hypothetical protein [Laspinema sp. D2c]
MLLVIFGGRQMKILGIAIARTLLLNLAAFIYLLEPLAAHPFLGSLINSLIFIFAVAYINQCIDWKRQGSRRLLDLVNLQKANLRHGVEGFVILSLAGSFAALGEGFYQGYTKSGTNSLVEPEMYQPSDTQVGLVAVIIMEILMVALYIFNERHKQKAATNKQSRKPGNMVKILGVAIARTLLLNLVLILCLVLFFSWPSPFLPAITLIFIVTYTNRYFEWKRQGSQNPFGLLNPRISNLRHGIDAFIITNLVGFIAGLGEMGYQAYLESITDGMTEIPTYQPTLDEIGLAVIAVEISVLALYIFNECQKEKAHKKKLAKAKREPLK